jgi:hypothetical protein
MKAVKNVWREKDWLKTGPVAWLSLFGVWTAKHGAEGLDNGICGRNLRQGTGS